MFRDLWDTVQEQCAFAGEVSLGCPVTCGWVVEQVSGLVVGQNQTSGLRAGNRIYRKGAGSGAVSDGTYSWTHFRNKPGLKA